MTAEKYRLALVILLASTVQSWAIPSPELVVGSISSLSQLLALASGLLAGATVIGVGARRSRAARGWIWAALVAGGLFAASAGLNVYQYMEGRAQEQARLEATLVRPSRTPGMPVVDPNLKELTYRDQLTHPLGISTQESSRLLEQLRRGERDDVLLIDVRERAEMTTGSLMEAIQLRYPDIDLHQLTEQSRGKTALLFCHNGNRSWETCAALARLGINCRFIVGGLEKWVVEGRPMTGMATRTLESLRAIPRYPNDRRLLTTPEVKTLLATEAAYFIDVRYPGEFAAGHLPNAVNLTIRTTPTQVLNERLAALPRRPVVLPCYDRRSCFFAEVMGLELFQAGHDVRGRYTVPWEYFPESARPPHVLAWQEEAQRGVWAKAVRALSQALQDVATHTGLVAAILLLALASRLVVLPFSLKAERDQAVVRAFSDELAKVRNQDDPVRRRRALRAFYRRHNITPAFNLLALLFLPLLALCVAAAHEAAVASANGALWFENLGHRDASLLLPVAFGTLVATYLHLTLTRSGKQRAAVWLLAFPLFVGAAALMSVAANLYIVASMGFLFAQWAIVQKPWRNLQQRRAKASEIVDLAGVGSRPDCGNKAYRLGKLIELGVNVPRGLVLTSAFLRRFAEMSPPARESQLHKIWSQLRVDRVAVRSSAAEEDGAQSSFAGVFDSVLDVGREDLQSAIVRVLASFSSGRAAGYGRPAGGANVIIQQMVEAEFSGVLFTRDPLDAGRCLLEFVKGTAENLVSGRVAPQAYRFGRLSGKPVGDATPELDLAPLLEIGRRLEQAFGAPQDIEWTYHEGQFSIVQCRNITSAGLDPLEAERDKALMLARGAQVDAVVFAQTEMTEVLPNPTPLSLSLMQNVWGPGGSVDLACRSLGLEYRAEDGARDYLVTIAGRLFVDKREEVSRAPQLSRLAGWRLNRAADRIAASFRNDFLDTFAARMAVLEAAEFKHMPTEQLLNTLREVRTNFVTASYAQVEVINIAAGFYLQEARQILDRLGQDPAVILAHMPEPRVALQTRAALAAYGSPLTRLIAVLGHRAPYDYELSCPRYSETPELLPMVANIWAAKATHKTEPVRLPRKAQALVDRARLFACLKEDGKHAVARELAVLRQIVLAVADRFGMRDEVFHLTFEELERMSFEGAHDISLQRADAAENFQAVRFPRNLTVEALEGLEFRAPAMIAAGDGVLTGVRVSGSSSVAGRALVVNGGTAADVIARMQEGDILVSPIVSPDWLPHFSRLGGVVAEVGGWLSHTAILAREFDLPMVVQVDGLASIVDGTYIEVSLDGAVRVIAT